jgi:HEPN domain-containing protein
MPTTDALLNDFAIRSFRDIADSDYIAARLSLRAQLIPQFLWQSLQALEKYLKCILVLNRIKAPKCHDLDELLKEFVKAKKFSLQLSSETEKFIEYLDTYGRFRYYETPYYTVGYELFDLDRAVWEVRRYARVLDYVLKRPDGAEVSMLREELKRNEAATKRPPQEFSIGGGFLERVLAKPTHPSRPGLVWHNLRFGKARRKRVMHSLTSLSGNSPLFLHPEILDEVLKYAFVPKDVANAYRTSQPKQTKAK